MLREEQKKSIEFTWNFTSSNLPNGGHIFWFETVIFFPALGIVEGLVLHLWTMFIRFHAESEMKRLIPLSCMYSKYVLGVMIEICTYVWICHWI